MGQADQSTYSRGQVEFAIWRAFSQGPPDAPINRTFRGRIRKLLDLDREQPEAPNVARFAFHSAPLRGKGVEVRFGLTDTFCLAIGLDLLDLGFKQSEVVFLLRYIRDELEHSLDEIRADPPALRAASDGADKRVFMLIRKVQVKELFRSAANKIDPVILKPDFCKGGALEEALERLGYSDRSRVITELSEIAVLIEQSLKTAPAIQRGRTS